MSFTDQFNDLAVPDAVIAMPPVSVMVPASPGHVGLVCGPEGS